MNEKLSLPRKLLLLAPSAALLIFNYEFAILYLLLACSYFVYLEQIVGDREEAE